MKENYNHISKLDAAKRQLEIAIRLFMSNSDIVAIHTLTAAAHSILRDLSKKQGKESQVKDTHLKLIKPQYHKVWRDKINEAENFFKHADKDHDKLLKFNPEQTESLLWDAGSMYQNITNEHTPLILIYRSWYFAKNPELIADSKIKAANIKSVTKLKLDVNNRYKFLEEYLPIATKINPST